jgi:hypothetical protein
MADDEAPVPARVVPLRRIPFTPQDESGIRALANWMQLAAVFGLVAAASKVLTAFWPESKPGNLIDAVLTLLLAVWTYQAGASFRQVSATDTADQRHLMEGFGHLRRVFLLQSVLVMLVLAFMVLAVGVMTIILLAKR